MAFNNIQRQMQDEMARFEAEISGAVSAPVQSSTQPAPSLPRPPAPPSSLMALASKGPSNLFLPPQLQKAGIRPAAASFSGPQQTGGAAIISNKPVLYKEKSGAPEEPAAKKPKAPEPSPVKPIAAPAKPAVVVPAPQVPSASYAEPSTSGAKIGLALKAPSSTIGSAAVKPPTEKKAKQKKPKKIVRAAGGTVWQDDSLLDWDPNDFRIFCGDLGNDVTDEVLARVFGRFPSFQKAKVIRDKRSNKSKGFGFVSFKDPQDFIRAMKELNGKYVGSRPIKLRKSNWKSRNIEEVKKKKKEKEVLLGKR